jgi:alkylation response protein AidB-like acyl-CoA dehydrogenase
VSRAIAAGTLPPPAASVIRLLHAEIYHLSDDLALRIVGAGAGTGMGTEQGVGGRVGTTYLMRQSSALGGGSSEMSRNIISERLLGMPREPATDRDIPFDQVKRGRV